MSQELEKQILDFLNQFDTSLNIRVKKKKGNHNLYIVHSSTPKKWEIGSLKQRMDAKTEHGWIDCIDGFITVSTTPSNKREYAEFINILKPEDCGYIQGWTEDHPWFNPEEKPTRWWKKLTLLNYREILSHYLISIIKS